MTTTAALGLLLVVLIVAAYARRSIAIVTAIAAMLVFNFFFLEPVGTFTVAHPENWAAFAAFISTALIASQLSASAHGCARGAGAGRRCRGRFHRNA